MVVFFFIFLAVFSALLFTIKLPKPLKYTFSPFSNDEVISFISDSTTNWTSTFSMPNFFEIFETISAFVISKIIDVSKFESLGLGSFYGVAMGAHEPAKLILVEYRGGNKGDKPIALVGKGLTFDSGGISIKPSAKMDEMKFDMCGSSAVMGVLKAVAELNPKLNIIFAIVIINKS